MILKLTRPANDHDPWLRQEQGLGSQMRIQMSLLWGDRVAASAPNVAGPDDLASPHPNKVPSTVEGGVILDISPWQTPRIALCAGAASKTLETLGLLRASSDFGVMVVQPTLGTWSIACWNLKRLRPGLFSRTANSPARCHQPLLMLQQA